MREQSERVEWGSGRVVGWVGMAFPQDLVRGPSTRLSCRLAGRGLGVTSSLEEAFSLEENFLESGLCWCCWPSALRSRTPPLQERHPSSHSAPQIQACSGGYWLEIREKSHQRHAHTHTLYTKIRTHALQAAHRDAGVHFLLFHLSH